MIVARTSLARKDIVSLSLSVAWRSRELWIGCAFWAIMIGALIAFTQGVPRSPRNWFALLVGAGVGALFTQVITAAFSIWRLTSSSAASDGVLGDHEYQLREEGLFEKTNANETLSSWDSVRSLRRSASSIIIEVPIGLFHFIPKRSFVSDASFDQFWEELRKYARRAT